jgi:hypothetical protein
MMEETSAPGVRAPRRQLSENDVALLDAYWRGANYLSVGQPKSRCVQSKFFASCIAHTKSIVFALLEEPSNPSSEGQDERNECNRLSHARKARGRSSCSEAYRPTMTRNKNATCV